MVDLGLKTSYIYNMSPIVKKKYRILTQDIQLKTASFTPKLLRRIIQQKVGYSDHVFPVLFFVTVEKVKVE